MRNLRPVFLIVLMFSSVLGSVSCQKTASVPAGEATGAEAPVIRMGFMICDSLEETKKRFEPLTRYLSEKTGIAIEAVYLNTFDVPEAFENRKIDITHTNSLLYVMMHEQGLKALAGEKRGEMGFASAGGIAVRADSPIKTLKDLVGKRMVFGPMMAPMGYMTQYELLLDAGIDPETDLEYYAIPWGAYKHEKVVYGVWMGAYDAAAVPLLDIEFMVRDRKIGADDLRLIAKGDPIPYCVFGAAPWVAPDIENRIRSALLNITPAAVVSVENEILSVLKAADVDGFVPIEDSDFERVREMARKTNMPPYQEF